MPNTKFVDYDMLEFATEAERAAFMLGIQFAADRLLEWSEKCNLDARMALRRAGVLLAAATQTKSI